MNSKILNIDIDNPNKFNAKNKSGSVDCKKKTVAKINGIIKREFGYGVEVDKIVTAVKQGKSSQEVTDKIMSEFPENKFPNWKRNRIAPEIKKFIATNFTFRSN